MPIGGSAYYDKLKKKQGVTPVSVPPKSTGPVPVSTPTAAIIEPLRVAALPSVVLPAGLKSKTFSKTVRPTLRFANLPTVSAPSKKDSFGDTSADPSAVDDVVNQILDLAQRVHSVAGQAEAAVLRAEAAVLKAELAVSKAEAAASKTETIAVKCELSVSKTEAAVYKSESASKRSDTFASKAGAAVGKMHLMSTGSSIAATEVSNSTSDVVARGASAEGPAIHNVIVPKKTGGPTSPITAMSMKLRAGMRQIEHVNEAEVERADPAPPNYGLRTPVGRDNLASGLVSLDNDMALPRVAPFIMDAFSHDANVPDDIAAHRSEAEAAASSSRESISSAA